MELGETDGVKFLAWKSDGVKFLTNSMSVHPETSLSKINVEVYLKTNLFLYDTLCFLYLATSDDMFKFKELLNGHK